MKKIDIGKNVREIRIARGMTQSDLADKLAEYMDDSYTSKAIGAW